MEWRPTTLLLEDISQVLVLRGCGQDEVKTKVVPITACKLATKFRHGHAVLLIQDTVGVMYLDTPAPNHLNFEFTFFLHTFLRAQASLTTVKLRFYAPGDLAQWLSQFDRCLQFLQNTKTEEVCWAKT